MHLFVKLNLYLLGGAIFGPFLAIYITFYGDFHSLSKEYHFLTYITDEWRLLISFGLFWMGFYSILSFLSTLKKIFNMPPKLEWWQNGIIYEIYVKSFHDSNGDGIGDLHGIAEKLDYIKKVGFNSIWLTPIYPSGGKDGGYDVTSFVDIDPVYGKMKDFEELVDKAHQKGIHILMDFIPNHTSNKHKWFIESCKSNDASNLYRDYYVWYPSKDKVNPPNNWLSVFGHSAWTYNESRQAWYYHQFLPEQPDLNLRCPAVLKELDNAIKFWLEEKNIDGFRVDAFKHLFESEDLEDEPLLPWAAKDIEKTNREVVYDDLKHTRTANQKETLELLLHWRYLFDEISRRTNTRKALIIEASYNIEDVPPYYKYKNKHGAHFPFNFQFCTIKQKSINAVQYEPNHTNHMSKEDLVNRSFIPVTVKKKVEEWNSYVPRDCWTNWELGNHDNPRIASRVGRENINIANALNLLLGGTPIVYYGEEIGMEDLPKTLLKFEDCQDEFGVRHGQEKYIKYTRDFYRTPMQWSSSKNGGFSKSHSKLYLPVHPNHAHVNVEDQMKDSRTHLKIFMDLVEIRKLPSFSWGSYSTVLANEQVFAFLRSAYDCPTFLVIVNLSEKNANANLLVSTKIAPRAYVTYYIPGHLGLDKNRKINTQDDTSEPVDLEEKYKLNNPVLTKNVFLKPHDCLILTWFSSN